MPSMSNRFWTAAIATAVASAALVACGGGSGSGAAAPGAVRLALTDAPACGFDHVYVTVDRVRMHQSGSASDADAGWSEVALATPKRLDLLTLTNGVLEELGQTSLPAGTYNQIRLVLVENGGNSPRANAVQPTGGAEVALDTPSAQQSGLKLKTAFTVESGKTSDLLLDFDACRSVVPTTTGSYNLKPVLTVTPRVATGVEGYVSTSLAAGTALVTAQQAGVVVRSAAPDGTGKFVLPSLPAGSYDIVVTAAGRSTAVVAGVPVSGTSSVTLNGTGSAIAPPVATDRFASGTTTTAATTTGGTTPVTDATVRASQVLTGGPTVEVARMPVNATTGAWQLRLAADAPVKAGFAGGAALTFNADTAVAGKYRLEASAPGRTTVQATTDVGTADQTVPLAFAP